MLKGKGLAPHYLVMTATPIPRTLALSYFADFEVSSIDHLPPEIAEVGEPQEGPGRPCVCPIRRPGDGRSFSAQVKRPTSLACTRCCQPQLGSTPLLRCRHATF